MKPNTIIASIIVCLLMVAPTVVAEDKPAHANINNKAPKINNVVLPNAVSPLAGSDQDVTVTFKVTDANGWQDIQTVHVTIYKPDNITVHRATGIATPTGQASGAQADYNYTFQMAFYDAPAQLPAGYLVRILATDAQLASSDPATEAFAYESLAALELDTASLSFGTVTPGERSQNTTVTVRNLGNVVIDLETAGADLSDGNGHSMDVDRVRFDLEDGDFSSELSLTQQAAAHPSFDLQPGPSATKLTWWSLDAPSADETYLPAGVYQGSVTLSAVAST